MKLLSWNCQGLGSPLTIRHLKRMQSLHAPVLMFLSETKNYYPRVSKIVTDLGFDSLTTVDPTGRGGGGLAMVWKNCIDLTVLHESSNFIDCFVRMGPVSFFLTGVYGDPIKERRARVWETISSFACDRNQPWLLFGDFNDIVGQHEKVGGGFEWSLLSAILETLLVLMVLRRFRFPVIGILGVGQEEISMCFPG